MTVTTLRRRGRSALKSPVVTATCSGDHSALLHFLDAALATALICVLRYRRHHFMTRGLAAKRCADEFLIHADEQLAHADLIAERIVQLGGEPDFAPASLCERGHARYVQANTLLEMIRENLGAARLTIDSYRGQLETLDESDPITRRMLEGILGVQEAHADELVELLGDSSIE